MHCKLNVTAHSVPQPRPQAPLYKLLQLCEAFLCNNMSSPIQHAVMISLVPRPSRGGGQRRPGIDCMRMRWISRKFSVKMSVKVSA